MPSELTQRLSEGTVLLHAHELFRRLAQLLVHVRAHRLPQNVLLSSAADLQASWNRESELDDRLVQEGRTIVEPVSLEWPFDSRECTARWLLTIEHQAAVNEL